MRVCIVWCEMNLIQSRDALNSNIFENLLIQNERWWHFITNSMQCLKMIEPMGGYDFIFKFDPIHQLIRVEEFELASLPAKLNIHPYERLHYWRFNEIITVKIIKIIGFNHLLNCLILLAVTWERNMPIFGELLDHSIAKYWHVKNYEISH